MSIQPTQYKAPLNVRDENITPDSKCPYCGHRFDRASGVTKDAREPAPQPKSGDITVCIACGGWCSFADDLTVRDLNAEEIASLDSETRTILTRISETVRLSHRR